MRMCGESLFRLKPYAFWLAQRWKLPCARSAGSLSIPFRNDWRERKASVFETLHCHSRGWAIEDWRSAKVDDKTESSYLNTVDYRRMHPLNGEYSSWIDDKLTLMYLCLAKGLNGLMPQYYYQVERGRILPLPDCPADLRKMGGTGIFELLNRAGTLAIKKIKGSLGSGFYRAEFSDGEVVLNDVRMSVEGFVEKVESLDGYIITEYLRPHEEMRRFSGDVPNTIRYLVGVIDGTPRFLKSFIRLGTKESGFVENYNSGGVLCYISEDGYFKQGNVIDKRTGRNSVIDRHPDTGEPLRGRIPLWDEVVGSAQRFCAHFPQLTYLGFDFVVTDRQQVKMLEINSLTSLDAIQLDGSILDTPNGDFFKERLIRYSGLR